MSSESSVDPTGTVPASTSQSIYYDNSGCSTYSVDFLRCNNVLSIIIFLLVFLILFVFLFYIISFAIVNSKRSGKSVHLIDGMIKGNEHKIIQQDPVIKDSKTIGVSENQSQGLEFSWSFWLYVNELGGNYQNIFVKGDPKDTDLINDVDQQTKCELSKACQGKKENMTPEEMQSCDDEELEKFKDCIYKVNGPGVYLTPNKNELMIVFNTFENLYETIKIDNLPIKKAIHVVVRCANKNVSVLFNGSLVKQKSLLSIPKQNYYNIHMGANGGFDGFLSDLWYYNYNIGFHELNEIYNKGPNTNLIGATDIDRDSAINSMNVSKENNFLSYKWFIN